MRPPDANENLPHVPSTAASRRQLRAHLTLELGWLWNRRYQTQGRIKNARNSSWKQSIITNFFVWLVINLLYSILIWYFRNINIWRRYEKVFCITSIILEYWSIIIKWSIKHRYNSIRIATRKARWRKTQKCDDQLVSSRNTRSIESFHD